MREASATLIVEKAREHHIPIYASIELTHRCNLCCRHCYLGHKNDTELNTGEIFEVIDRLAESGTLELSLTGGEALLRDDFFDIAAYVRKKHMAITLLSNGTLLGQNAIAMMKRLHFAALHISLLGGTPPTHEAITGVAGSFARTVAGIEMARQAGLKVIVKTSVMRQNVSEMGRIDDFCQRIGATLIANPLLVPDTGGSRYPLQYRIGNRQLRKYLFWERMRGRESHGLVGTCNAGVCSVAISTEGKVYPCLALRLEAGDLRRETFNQVWEDSPVFQRLRQLSLKDFAKCAGCHLLRTCVRCPGSSLREKGDMLAPSQESCRIARIGEEVKSETEKYREETKEKIR